MSSERITILKAQIKVLEGMIAEYDRQLALTESKKVTPKEEEVLNYMKKRAEEEKTQKEEALDKLEPPGNPEVEEDGDPQGGRRKKTKKTKKTKKAKKSRRSTKRR